MDPIQGVPVATRVKLRDKTGMAVLAAQPPLLAAVMWLAFPKPTTALMFMPLSCSGSNVGRGAGTHR